MPAQRFALAAGRTGETPSPTRAIAGKAAPYHQGEALSAARFVRRFFAEPTLVLGVAEMDSAIPLETIL